MPIIANKTGSNLTLLGYSSKREYFGNAVSFRQIDTYNYEYTILDLISGYNGQFGLSQLIASGISGQIGIFSGDVTIRALDIPSAYETPQDQIRTAKYNVTVEVRKPITNISDISGIGDYSGIDFIRNAYYSLNNFSENYSFENQEDSQKINHAINFELRTGDRFYAQSIASGILSTSEPNFGLGVLSGYLSIYNDSSSFNYYTETYDSFKNTYAFSKTKNLYKLSGSNYTFSADTKVDYNDGIIIVSDDLKVKGKKNFSDAKAGLDSLLTTSYARSNSAYTTYQNFSTVSYVGTLFSTPLKTTKKYNVPGFMAEASQTFTNNPLYKSDFKQDQTITLSKDILGIVSVNNQYNFTWLKNITDDIFFTGISHFTPFISTGDANTYYQANDLNHKTLNNTSMDFKVSRRKRSYTVNYDYSDDPRYFVTITPLSGSAVVFNNIDYKYVDTKPKDNITEYKVINKSQTLINYAYQQQPGNKTVSLTAVRARPLVNQLTSFNVPVSEMNALYTKSLQMLVQNFTSLIGLNYYLSNLTFSIDSENKIDLSATINYTNKKYVR